MQCSFAKQNTGHGTNAAKKVAAAPADTYRRSGKPPLQIIVLKTQLLAFRRPFLRKIASRCSTGSVPRRVERSGRRRPPCRGDRGRKPCSQADWRKSCAFPPIRMHLPCREAAFPHSACSCPAENRSVELCRPCVLSFFDFCFATLFPIIYNKGGFLTCPIRNTSGASPAASRHAGWSAPCAASCPARAAGRVRMPSFPVCAASVHAAGRKASPDAGNARFFPAGRACFPLRGAAADALPPLCAACGRTAQTRLRRIWPPMKRRACCTIATQCILPAIMTYRKMRRRFYACCGRDPNHDSGRMARLIFAKRCFE